MPDAAVKPALFIQLTHTGFFPDGRVNTNPVLITDLDVGYEAQLRKVPVYVPVGGSITIPASSRSMLSFYQGVIAKFAQVGVITAKMFYQPERYTNATLPASSTYPLGVAVWNTDQHAPNFADGGNWVSFGSGILVFHETYIGVGNNARSLGTIASNAASALPTAQQNHYRTIDVSFPAGWTGGNVSVVGLDRYGLPITGTAVFPAGGGLVKVHAVFSSVTSFTNSAPGGAGGAATVQIGTELGTGQLPLSFVKLSVNGIQEAFAGTDIPNGSFTPTTAPNGNRNYEVWYTANILVPV